MEETTIATTMATASRLTVTTKIIGEATRAGSTTEPTIGIFVSITRKARTTGATEMATTVKIIRIDPITAITVITTTIPGIHKIGTVMDNVATTMGTTTATTTRTTSNPRNSIILQQFLKVPIRL